VRSVLGQGLAVLIARLLVPAFSLAINIGLARLAGTAVLGAYVELVTALLVMQTVAGAGMAALLGRDFAGRPHETAALLRVSRTFGLLSGSAALAGLAAYAMTVSLAAPAAAVAIVAVTTIPSAWITIHEAFFLATGTPARITIIALVENALKFAVAGAALAWGGGLVALCMAIALGRAVALLMGHWYISRARLLHTWRLSVDGLDDFFHAVLPFGALLTLSMLYFRVDVLIVGGLRGPAETGLYAAALSLHSAVLLVPDSVMAAVYPRLAARFHHSRESYVNGSLATLRLLLVIVVPTGLVLFAAAGPLLTMLYGREFAGSADTLRLLTLSLPLHAVNGVLGQALQAGHRQAAVLRIVSTGLSAQIALTIVLVSRYGYSAAPVALVLSSLIVALANAVVFYRHAASLNPVKWAINRAEATLIR
jgi:O-antigen/teichoic acid export membrane protein